MRGNLFRRVQVPLWLGTVVMVLALVLARNTKGRTLNVGSEKHSSSPKPSAEISAADALERSSESLRIQPTPSRCAQHPQKASTPISSRVESIFSWLADRQSKDGSWGDFKATVSSYEYTKQSATALALLTFLGTGEGDRSARLLNHKPLRQIIRQGLNWLEDNPASDPLSVALVATAFLQNYEMREGDGKRKEVAQGALDRLLSMQMEDGSWGHDSYVTSLAAEALLSAHSSELLKPGEHRDRASAFLREGLRKGDTMAGSGFVLLTGDRDDICLLSASNQIASSPPAWTMEDYSAWYVNSLTLFHARGKDSEVWKSWDEHFRAMTESMEPAMFTWLGEEGTTAGVVKNSLIALSLEVSYRYRVGSLAK